MKNRRLAAAVLLFILSAALAFLAWRMATNRYREASELMAAGNYPAARATFELAMRDDPNNGVLKVDCLDSIAQCYYRERNYQAALQTCVKFQSLPGGAPRAHVVRGHVYRATDRPADAEREFANARRFGDRVSSAWKGGE